jgi:hypothetical protein
VPPDRLSARQKKATVINNADEGLIFVDLSTYNATEEAFERYINAWKPLLTPEQVRGGSSVEWQP